MTTKILGTSWRWGVASRRSCSTTSHGSTTTSLLTQQSSLRQRVSIETGRYRNTNSFTEDIDLRYMCGANPNKTQRERLSEGVRSVISSASCWSTWKDLERRRRSLNMWISLHKARLSYLRSMRAQLLRTPRPSGLKLWLSLVRVQRTNVSLPDRPLLNRLWISRTMRIHGQKTLLRYSRLQGRYAITRTQRMGSHSFQQIVGYRMLEELSDKLGVFLIV